MKGQDIGLLLALSCLQMRENDVYPVYDSGSWEDWILEDDNKSYEIRESAVSYNQYAVRALALLTGISKSQVNLSLQRSLESGLARLDKKTRVPRANIKALSEFIIYGLPYVFPAKPGAITRGISTSLAAPVLQLGLLSAGDLPPVWSDAKGNSKGQAIEPLFKSATYAIRQNAELYALLALVDAIRIGQSRERNLAINALRKRLSVTKGSVRKKPITNDDDLIVGNNQIVSRRELNRLVKAHHIKKLALFGSAARGELKQNSDVDLLVEFEETKSPSLSGMVKIQDDFSSLFGGRPVDIATKSILDNPYRRREIEKDMEVLYAA